MRNSVDILKIEELVRATKTKEATSLLRSIKIKNMAREDSIQLANLSWRVGIPLQGLRFLKPWINNKNKLSIASIPQILEYCACLLALGSYVAVENILQNIPEDKNPKVLLYLGFSKIYGWDYKNAIYPLEKYGQSLDFKSYEWLVAHLNILACQIANKAFSEAESTVLRIESNHLLLNYSKIKIGFFELKAQLFFGQNKFQDALFAIRESKKLITVTDSYEYFLCLKWILIIKIKIKPSRKYLNELFILHQKSQKKRYYEIVRDCELYLSFLLSDFDLALKIYHFTPFQFYKNKVVELLPTLFQNHDKQAIVVRNINLKQLDPTNANKLSMSKSFPSMNYFVPKYKNHLICTPGSKVHQLMLILFRDLYKPISLVFLFNELYPGEFFDPDSSLQRLKQILIKLRNYLKKWSVPIQVLMYKGELILKINNTLSIEIQNSKLLVNKNYLWFLSVFNLSKMNSLSIKDIIFYSDYSERQVRRMIKYGIENKMLIKNNFKKRIVYSLVQELI